MRAGVSDLEVSRATAESDLTHLAQSCIDGVQASLDEVLIEVEQMEAAGETTPDAAAISAEEPDPEAEEGQGPDESSDVVEPRHPTAQALRGPRGQARLANPKGSPHR